MRILHTSDWHLGRTFHGRVLDEAHAVFADHLVELVQAERIDAVVVAGDVYDRAIPPIDSVRLLDDTLRRLSERTRVVLTPGNHDSAQRLGFGAGLLREGITIRARTPEVDRPVIIPDRGGGAGLYIYALPYLDPDAARESLPPLLDERLGESAPATTTSPDDEEAQGAPRPWLLARSHQAVVAGALRLVAKDLASRRARDDRRVPALVMSHAFVVGGQASAESERDIRVGGVDSVPSEVYTALGAPPLAPRCGTVDYVALGHLHRPQEIRTRAAGPRLVYSGSPLPFSFPEATTLKSTVVLELGPGGVTSLERVAAPCPYEATTLTGTLEELLGPRTSGQTGHWVRIELTGPMPPDAMARLKERFTNLLAFSHRPPQRQRREAMTVTRSSDPVKVADRFLAQMLGRDPDPVEHSIMEAAHDAVKHAAAQG